MPTGNPPPPPPPSSDDRDRPHPPIGWRAKADGDGLWLSPEWTSLTGQAAGDAIGRGWLEHVHPEDRARVLAAWQQARTAGRYAVDLRVRTAADGSYRWFRAQAAPGPDAGSGWHGVAVDITDLQQQIAGEATLRATLHHRVRNTLSVIRSIARRTAENSETVEDYRNHFDGRLAAFARAQSHIMRTGDHGVDLEVLVADEILAARAGARVAYAGPEIRLPARIAEQIGMALHELAINAVQFGALSGSSGRVRIAWQRDPVDPELLRIDWQETVPDGGVRHPDTDGFGMELLTRSLRYELDAEVTLDFADTGVRCAIVLRIA